MYNKLIDHYEGSKIIRGWRLCKKLCELLINRTDKLDAVIFYYQTLIDEFNRLFPDVPEEFFISLFCAVLPDKYDYLISDMLSKDNVTYDQIIKHAMATSSRERESHSNDKSNKLFVGNIQSNKKIDNEDKSKKFFKKKDYLTKRKSRNCEYCKEKGRKYIGPTKEYCTWYLKA